MVSEEAGEGFCWGPLGGYRGGGEGGGGGMGVYKMERLWADVWKG